MIISETSVLILSMIVFGSIMFLLKYYVDKDLINKTDKIDKKPQRVRSVRRIWLGRGTYFDVFDSTTERKHY